jgi:CrcB protein
MAVIVYSNRHPSPLWWWRPALGTGFCGGFTTYSAFAVQVQQYMANNNTNGALLYITASLVGSYVIAVAVHKAVS